MNKLEHAAEFRSVLAHYQPSELAKEVLEAVRLVLLVGPTASGRNRLIEELVKTGNYYDIVSDTTREKRTKDGIPIEEDGVEYWFRSEEEVLSGLRKGEYVEAAIIHNQQVSGPNVREFEAAHREKKIAIMDIETIGAQTTHRLKPDTLIIFMIPPSFDIWMERLHMRGQMEPEELERRLISAKRELSSALESDIYRYVLNDTIEGTTAEVNRLVMEDSYDPFKEHLSRETAQKLLGEVEAYLRGRSERGTPKQV